MSDEHDEESKTEAASARRLEQLAGEGNLPIGRDVATLGAFAAGIATLVALGGRLGATLVDGVTATLTRPQDAPALGPWLPVLGLGSAVCCAAALGGAVPLIAQTGGRVWSNLAVPDLSRLWKLDRLTRLVTKQGLADLGAAVLKVTFLAAACRWALTDAFVQLAGLLDAPSSELVSSWLSALVPVALKLLGAVALVAGLDLALARWKFSKDTRMTREESRREHREDEGDPMVKSKRKKKQRELAKHRVAIDVPRADAIIVNPTHVAIAVRYRKEEGGAPRVLAKGKGALAEVIRDIARANGIAIVQDIPLARLLHKRVRVGGFVPKDTFKAVATVLAHVYRLQQRR